jgi:hypothetical protein
MDREEIIRMAREAGLAYGSDDKPLGSVTRFASLVAAAEREAIAQSLDKQADFACDEIDKQWAQEMAAAVRARGEKI